MGKRNISARRGKNLSSKEIIFLCAIVLISLLVWYVVEGRSETQAPDVTVSDECEIVMIDVGQGDAFLLRSGEACVLIDTGTGKERGKLDAYLKSAGVARIDYLILSHPHEDHIGNADYVIKNYKVAHLVMPDAQTNTSCFERLLNAADRAGLEIEVPLKGDVFSAGDMRFTVLNDDENVHGSNLNLYSLVIRMDFGEVSALFTGDAEKWNENELLKGDKTLLDCDILKVGHHGSDTSNSDKFIAAVSPSVGLISCGAGNDYGHPHKNALKVLQKYKVTVYRTDLESTVSVVTDGKNIWRERDN